MPGLARYAVTAEGGHFSIVINFVLLSPGTRLPPGEFIQKGLKN